MDILKNDDNTWHQTSNRVFWGEMAPYDHVVQIYEDNDEFIELLAGFVTDGIDSDDGVIIIATAAHLATLQHRVEAAGYQVSELILKGRYFPLDAEKTLSQFMVNGWPDENLFNQVVADLIIKAKGESRKVRAFGEMVAILWAKGQVGATVRLEHLWNKFCENEAFCLFCAYPKSGFTQDASESLMHICGAHSKMVAHNGKSKTDVFYRQYRAVGSSST